MIDWHARASAYFLANGLPPHHPNPRNGVSEVLSVGGEAISTKNEGPQNEAEYGPAAAHPRWSLHFIDRDDLLVTFAPPVTHDEVLHEYPGAMAAVPLPEPAVAPVPADLLALFDACLAAGLYDEDDRPVIPAMLGADPQGTRGLIESTHSRIGRCPRCTHFLRPGQSGGYCTERSDLPRAYGLMHELPGDHGAQCAAFENGREPGPPSAETAGLPTRRASVEQHWKHWR